MDESVIAAGGGGVSKPKASLRLSRKAKSKIVVPCLSNTQTM